EERACGEEAAGRLRPERAEDGGDFLHGAKNGEGEDGEDNQACEAGALFEDDIEPDRADEQGDEDGSEHEAVFEHGDRVAGTGPYGWRGARRTTPRRGAAALGKGC